MIEYVTFLLLCRAEIGLGGASMTGLVSLVGCQAGLMWVLGDHFDLYF